MDGRIQSHTGCERDRIDTPINNDSADETINGAAIVPFPIPLSVAVLG
jgi:hypothetical protein